MTLDEIKLLIDSGDDRVITISETRNHSPGCVAGWREFIEGNGFDWKASIRNGLLASQILSMKDARADALVIYKYELPNV